MAALPADIAAATRDALIVTWVSAIMAGRYANARDGSIEPAEGYCDAQADAQVLVNNRGDLIGIERRRFAVAVHDLLWIDPTAGIPTAQLVDAEQAVAAPHLSARIEIDLETETTSLELFG